ncbi:preprotein translocase subunit SecE [Candidatus Uhrbacteria bacterium]|nr:preprotein translocase subunit SecE [Candidatus Uhrbacteria bacterium]
MSALTTAIQATTRYFRDSYNEMRSVVWPSRKQTVLHTIMVIVFSIIIAVFLGSLDLLFSFILEKTLVK